MSRAIENYICASEDRPHYDNEGPFLYGFGYPMRRPEVTVYQTVYKTVYENGISEDKVNELIDSRISDISDNMEFYPIPEEEVKDIIEEENS